MEKEMKETIQKTVIKKAFEDNRFAGIVAEAVGDNIVKAIRDIDSWDFKYEIRNLLSEVIFNEDFKSEIKIEVSKMITENKEEIKKLVIENVNSIVVNGVIEASQKIGELLTSKITDIKSIY